MAKKLKISITVTEETMAKIIFMKRRVVPNVPLSRGDVIDFVVGEKYLAMGGPFIKNEEGIVSQSWVKNNPKEK